MSEKLPIEERRRIDQIDARLAEIDRIFMSQDSSTTAIDENKLMILRSEALRLIGERGLIVNDSFKKIE